MLALRHLVSFNKLILVRVRLVLLLFAIASVNIPWRAPSDVRQWEVIHVSYFVRRQGFEEFVSAFEDNEIDGPALLSLNAETLKERLGMTKRRDRACFLSAVQVLRTRSVAS